MYSIAVIGLGYVGLPLAVALSEKHRVIGYDVDNQRISELQAGVDGTHSFSQSVLTRNERLQFSCDESILQSATVYIIAVPTPIDRYDNPDLTPLCAATASVAHALKKGDIVIYESTVFPGCTEERCVPILERASGLKYNVDFCCGYSPERLNPGDTEHTLANIQKIIAGSNEHATAMMQEIYAPIIHAGLHIAPSIRVAEMAKVVENAQRDLNISFMNELALLCDRLHLDTHEVIDAAATKWNFMPFRPGLVGGHCISVDPYYLVYKAKEVGYVPQVITSGRRVNNSIAKFIADKTLKLMIQKGLKIKNASVLVLGITFKENCADIRNTKVYEVIKELQLFGCQVDTYDPVANAQDVQANYGITLLPCVDSAKRYDAVILCVSHTAFNQIDFQKYHEAGAVIFDAKGVLPKKLIDSRL